MTSADSRRRKRFVLFFDTALLSDRAKLIDKSGLTKGRVAQLFDEAQPFGERAARNLALALGLPEDYFEHDTVAGALVTSPHVVEEPVGLRWNEDHEDRVLLDHLRAIPPHRVEEIRKAIREESEYWRAGYAQFDKQRSTATPPKPPRVDEHLAGGLGELGKRRGNRPKKG